MAIIRTLTRQNATAMIARMMMSMRIELGSRGNRSASICVALRDHEGQLRRVRGKSHRLPSGITVKALRLAGRLAKIVCGRPEGPRTFRVPWTNESVVGSAGALRLRVGTLGWRRPDRVEGASRRLRRTLGVGVPIMLHAAAGERRHGRCRS